MLNYAFKRLTRGPSIFIALFLSVLVAVILFSGIIQGADAVACSMISRALEAVDIDVESWAEQRNVTRLAIEEMENAYKMVKGVIWVDHLIRWEVEVNVSGWEEPITFTLIAIPENSTLLQGISGVEGLERGKIYIEAESLNASGFTPGTEATIKILTYNPYRPPGFESRQFDLPIGGVVKLNEETFSLAMGRYPLYLRYVILGGGMERRPPYRLIIVGEETLRDHLLRPIYDEGRRPARVFIAAFFLRLERERLINPWDIEGSRRNIRLVYEEINTIGVKYRYLPLNYLDNLLGSIESYTSGMKTNTLMVAFPVFFTSWYLGATVSEISFGVRRREIGLLFTRGLTHRQVMLILLLEASLIGLIAGALGILVGAAIIPFVLPTITIGDALKSLSLPTIAISLLFSGVLSILAVYNPARRAIGISVVEALRTYREEEEVVSWHEPLLALSFGAYKVLMMLLGINVENFRPTMGNIIVFILYSTWWGVDYILSYIGPILFFWGFIKLLVQFSPWLQSGVSLIARWFIGDVSKYSSMSARRYAKRLASSAFMVALILGYAVSVIGSAASTEDFIDRVTWSMVGADASVWLFSRKGAEELADRIEELPGVQNATVEVWFEAESSLGTIPIRAIEPLEWREVAYLEPGWLEGEDIFGRMNESRASAILEKGAAERLGVDLNETFLIKLKWRIYSFEIVGFFGRKPRGAWRLQNPTLYIHKDFLKYVKEKYIKQVRILVKLERGADVESFQEAVKALDPNVDEVDIAELRMREARENIFLMGPRRVEELGVYFSAVVSSLGAALIALTMLRSRWRELTILATRGLSWRQIAASLILEMLSVVAFSVLIGSAVGYIILRNETALFNQAVATYIERRIIFPSIALRSILSIAVTVSLSSIIPILVAARIVSRRPVLMIEE
jgi:ABC-type lipoprotein release transport system permease subunit